MKKGIVTLALTAIACYGATAQTVLEGSITANTSLNANTCYLLRGCVQVESGATLTIPAGTKILGEKATRGTLIIKRGAKIAANGIASNPIVFTSNQPAGSRAPGDWGGIVIAGYATNNQPGDTFKIEGPCEPIYAGGTNDADNSGVMRFVQLHYAGIPHPTLPDNELNSLTMAAVGNGTVIENIQVTYANDDAYEWFGGAVNCKNLIAYNTKDDDFDTDFGYHGKVQFAFAYRRDPNQHDISGSNGIESDNDATGSANGPKTHPIFSNVTLLGPLYANATAHAEFRRGMHIRRNSEQNVYNSVIVGWPLEGLYVDGATTIANTGTNLLNSSYNTYYNNAGGTIGSTAWSGSCAAATSAAVWLNVGATGTSCLESGNSLLASAPGYSGTLTSAVCPAKPSFTLTTNNLGAPTYTGVSDLADAFFVKTGNFRGAFGTTDWTLNWTNWCPNATSYCNLGAAAAKAAAPALQLVPNPTNGTTYAVFEAAKAGKVRLVITDKVTGMILRSVTADVQAGEQRVAFNAAGLSVGVYFVRVEMADGTVTAGQLSVN
ncbi:T9SS type A sorting domain-containing protein [Taibaiella chishuiensis]|uniref:Putative secreted protein (Por secretion system target) n=1 Tax=Taibaiella chishuiensis TaxID=1434707 RepID=A0A2P8D0H8_9BACT|nr:T9SS type A sorting domain-containing protein [Taibaiella chishuiensis]PSK90728.1 putative secreted protein (Por secretion system target) [Taibaiella chishuiensis]